MDNILNYYKHLDGNFLNADNLKDCAKRLMCEFCIVKGDFYYQIGEIEFYYYSPNHKDIITYPRNCFQGLWFFHQSGVDLTIQSKVDGENPNFGGILIRSVRKYTKEGTCIKTICGPQRCVNELFDYLNAIDNSIERTPKIIKYVFPDCEIDIPTQRFISFDVRSTEAKNGYQIIIEKKIVDKLNAILKANDKYKNEANTEQAKEWLITDKIQNSIDLFKSYLIAPYRFYLKGFEWESDYKARPQNIAKNGSKFLFIKDDHR